MKRVLTNLAEIIPIFSMKAVMVDLFVKTAVKFVSRSFLAKDFTNV